MNKKIERTKYKRKNIIKESQLELIKIKEKNKK